MRTEETIVPAGVPLGTKLGPWLFVLMINDLDTNAQQWKYGDDTTAVSYTHLTLPTNREV